MKFTITRIFLYLCCATLFFSCTHEKDFIENNNRDFKISKKPFKELLLLESFNKAYEKVKAEKQRNKTLRTALEDEFNFTIVEGRDVNIVEKENYTYYNILIERTVNDSLYFENLVLKISANEDMDAFIAKYNKNNLNATIFQEGDIELTAIINKVSSICFSVCEMLCNDLGSGEYSTPHSPDSGCSGGNISLDCRPICFSSGGGGGYDGGPAGPSGPENTSPSGGGGSGGGTPPPPYEPQPNNNGAGSGNNEPEPELVVLPVFNLDDDLGPETPCQTLKKHLSTVTGVKLKAILPGLQAKVTERGERGKSLVKSTSGTYTTPDIPAVTGLLLTTSFGGNIFGSIHTHPKDTALPMFSFTDVYSLRLFYEGATEANLPEVVIYLVCKEAGVNKTYALKIDDYDAFYDAIIADIAASNILPKLAEIPEDEREQELLRLMDEKVRNLYVNNPYNLQQAFLNHFGAFGISLYEVNNIGTNWNKLTLKNPIDANDPIEKTPCKK